jgi:hypothetical protein
MKLGYQRRGILSLADELNPLARLKDGSIGKAVENTPVERVKFDDVALHPLSECTVPDNCTYLSIKLAE